MSIPTDNDITNTGEMVAFMEEGESLKNKAKRLWLFGEWDKLSSISTENTQNNDEIAVVSLLISSALLQRNKSEQAERQLKKSIQHGASKALLAKILIAGANNTLGRISSLQEKSDAAKKYFLNAVDIGINDPELIAQSRAIKEMSNLGLFPQSVDLIKSDLACIENTPSQVKNINIQIKILKTQVELLQHELSLSQQKLQIYRTRDESPLENLTTGSPEYIERIRQLSPSQLGQDLWVLEKSNYKKGGFFVEFGATDGVLLSNTYLLEKQFGWSGICAEPNPKFYKNLKENRGCITSDSCIAGETGNTVEFVFADEYGGIREYIEADSHAEKRLAFQQANEIAHLTTISLDEFLEKHNAPRAIDYLSIDTEGSEYEILSQFPFEKWNISLISVEHNYTPMRGKILDLLTAKGYMRTENKFDDWYFKGKS